MRTGLLLLAGSLVAGAALAADSTMLLTGSAAFADWRVDAPGVRRLITPADLPPPFATASVANRPGRAPRTPAVAPRAPPDFAVDLFASGLADPRVVRTVLEGLGLPAEAAGNRFISGIVVLILFYDGIGVIGVNNNGIRIAG